MNGGIKFLIGVGMWAIMFFVNFIVSFIIDAIVTHTYEEDSESRSIFSILYCACLNGIIMAILICDGFIFSNL